MTELLSPAGNFEKMKAAFLYGADAVYLAYERFGMRAAADNFTLEELKEALLYAHSRGKKIYLTLNTLPRENEYPELERFIKILSEMDDKIDAAIVADAGVFALIKSVFPSLEIHISTQAGIVSSADCLFWYNLGAKRAVLARELSLEEIKMIKKNIPEDMELEVFVHGSMCISFSGRCLLSNNLVSRDANRGMCAQPCRWNYTIREEKRQDTAFPIEEEKEGTYIMSSKDMCMVEYMSDLIRAGITSFKIEGRMKSAYYAAVVTNAYRAAIDGYMKDGDSFVLDKRWTGELESVSHREYCTGYFFDDPMKNAQTCTMPGYMREKAYLAVAIEDDKEKGLSLFIQRNKLCVGDKAELISPGKFGRDFKISEMYDENMNVIESAPHPFMKFYIKVPFEVREGDILRGASV